MRNLVLRADKISISQGLTQILQRLHHKIGSQMRMLLRYCTEKRGNICRECMSVNKKKKT